MKLLYWVWSAIIQTVVLSSAVSANSRSNGTPARSVQAHVFTPSSAPVYTPAHTPNHVKGSSAMPFRHVQQIKTHMNTNFIDQSVLKANDSVTKAENDFIMAKNAIHDVRKQALMAERSAVKAVNEKVNATKQQLLKATRNMILVKKQLAKAQKQAKKIKTMAHSEAIRKKAEFKKKKAIETQENAIAKQLLDNTKERFESVKRAIAETKKVTEAKIKRISSFEKHKQHILRRKYKLDKKRIDKKTRKEIHHIKLNTKRELKKTRDACYAMMKRHGLLIKKQYQKIKKQIALIKSLRIKQHDLIKQKQDTCLASLNEMNEHEDIINTIEEQQIIKALEVANKRAGCNTSKVCKTIDVNVCHCLDYGFIGITNCLAAISKLELENTIAVKLAKELKSIKISDKKFTIPFQMEAEAAKSAEKKAKAEVNIVEKKVMIAKAAKEDC